MSKNIELIFFHWKILTNYFEKFDNTDVNILVTSAQSYIKNYNSMTDL